MQALLAGSLAVTVLTARLVLGSRLRRMDAVARRRGRRVPRPAGHLLRTAGHSATGRGDPDVPGPVPVPIALIGWLAARADRSSVSATAAGLAFGGAALCARSVTIPELCRESLSALAGLGAQPLVWALTAFGVTGMLLYASTLEHGNPGAVTAVLWIAEVVASAAAGVAFLGDRPRPGWEPVAVIALVGACACAVQLAAIPAGSSHRRPTTPSPDAAG